MEFVEVAEARERTGLRLVVVAGLPSPWSEAAKGILQVKKIPFAAVRLGAGDRAVSEWTGQTSAPVARFDGERPRSGWAEILLLAERLAPEPRLIPADPAERALLFGLAHEICGELGLGWCRRLSSVHASLDSEGAQGFPVPVAKYLGDKYGLASSTGPQVRARVLELLGMFARRLHVQREAGSRYYLGDSLTALDIYSAAFMVLFQPLPPEQCPMPEMIRSAFQAMDEETAKAVDPVLIEHRDFVYQTHLELPISL